jgi:hypothetical protein
MVIKRKGYKMKNFMKNVFIGIIIGLILSGVAYALWVGMGREIARQEKLADYYCENYGACGGNNDK